MSSATAVTASSFESEVARSPIPVLIDFWAEWCAPCRSVIAPAIDELAKTYAGRIKMVSIDADAENGLADRFGVVSVPTLVVMNKGSEYSKKAGAVPKHEIERLFRDLL